MWRAVVVSMRAAVLALMLVALTAGQASAAGDDQSVSPFQSRSTAIFAVVGLGTPVGLVGAEVEQMLLPFWSFSAGAGWGAANAPQISMMTRWLGGGLRSKVTIGAGISHGKYTWSELFCFDCEDGPVTKTGTVTWGNVEIGGEHRFWSGFALRYFGGYGHIIAGDLVCDNAPAGCGPYYQNDGYNVVYTGIGVGGAF
jgi:hypothetical protein